MGILPDCKYFAFYGTKQTASLSNTQVRYHSFTIPSSVPTQNYLLACLRTSSRNTADDLSFRGVVLARPVLTLIHNCLNKEESLPRQRNSLSIATARPALMRKVYDVAGEKEDLCVRLGILQRHSSVKQDCCSQIIPIHVILASYTFIHNIKHLLLYRSCVRNNKICCSVAHETKCCHHLVLPISNSFSFSGFKSIFEVSRLMQVSLRGRKRKETAPLTIIESVVNSSSLESVDPDLATGYTP